MSLKCPIHDVRLAYRGFENGEFERRDLKPAALDDVLAVDIAAAESASLGAASPLAWGGDFDDARCVGYHPVPEGRGFPAEHSVRSCTPHNASNARVRSERAVDDEIHPAMNRSPGTRSHRAVHSIAAQAAHRRLRAGDHAVVLRQPFIEHVHLDVH